MATLRLTGQPISLHPRTPLWSGERAVGRMDSDQPAELRGGEDGPHVGVHPGRYLVYDNAHLLTHRALAPVPFHTSGDEGTTGAQLPGACSLTPTECQATSARRTGS